MRGVILYTAVAALVAGVGTYLLLPHRHGATRPRRVQGVGAILASVGVVLLALLWSAPGSLVASLFFYAFAAGAVAGGIQTVVSRNPVHSALWFAAVVLFASGLFLVAGAQFLAAGTIIVYAGAIIVTFLFVIMLAQAEGLALYDRMARAPIAATATCFVLLFALVGALAPLAALPATERPARTGELAGAAEGQQAGEDALARVVGRSVRVTSLLDPPAAKPSNPVAGRPAPHVAGLGGTLYTDHLIVVELAGALLFVAMVAAAAIATPRPPVRPGQSRLAPIGSDPAQIDALGRPAATDAAGQAARSDGA